MVINGPKRISETKIIFVINILVAFLTIYPMDTQSIRRNVNITLPKELKVTASSIAFDYYRQS